MADFLHRTVILANGDFPQSAPALAVLASAERVVCCDGAAEKLLAYGRCPDAVVGDLDSLSRKTAEACREVVAFEAEQETNDLCKAFRFCLSRHYAPLVILGATGLREDHTLGNISHLADFIDLSPDIAIVTDTGYFMAVRAGGVFEAVPGQQISIFSFDPEQKITSAGLKYPLEGLCLKRWWNATLNEVLGDSFTLTVDRPGPLLVYFCE